MEAYTVESQKSYWQKAQMITCYLTYEITKATIHPHQKDLIIIFNYLAYTLQILK